MLRDYIRSLFGNKEARSAADYKHLEPLETNGWPGTSGTTQWPTFQGNNFRTGYCPETIDPPLRQLWKFESNGTLFCPIVAGGLVLSGNSKRVLHAISAKSGQQAWEFHADPGFMGIKSSAAANHDRVFFGCLNGAFYALELKTGRKLWQSQIPTRPGNPFGIAYQSHPLAAENRVVVLGSDELCILDARNGELLWTLQDPEWLGSSLAGDSKTCSPVFFPSWCWWTRKGSHM